MFKNSKIKVNNVKKINHYQLIGLTLLLLLTLLSLTQSYHFAMMGLTTFILAYLSKGMRRKK